MESIIFYFFFLGYFFFPHRISRQKGGELTYDVICGEGKKEGGILLRNRGSPIWETSAKFASLCTSGSESEI